MHVVRAYASRRPDLPSWGPYQEWCAAYKSKQGRDYRADISLITDADFIRTANEATQP